jgi:uncharacterized metal-binding protein
MGMSEENKSCCGPLSVNLVFACSGASDVGCITDQAARKVARSKTAYMSCVAAIGAQIPDIMDTARSAKKILVMDGCEKDCGRVCFERVGLKDFIHLQLERDMGMEKRKSPPTEERIAEVVTKSIDLLSV